MNTNKLPYIIGGTVLLLLVGFLLEGNKTQNKPAQTKFNSNKRLLTS